MGKFALDELLRGGIPGASTLPTKFSGGPGLRFCVLLPYFTLLLFMCLEVSAILGIKTQEDDNDVDTSKSFIKTLCLSKI